MADMPQPTMADMRRTMVTGTAIGDCIVRPTRTMVGPAIMAVGIEVGVTAGKRVSERMLDKERRTSDASLSSSCSSSINIVNCAATFWVNEVNTAISVAVSIAPDGWTPVFRYFTQLYISGNGCADADPLFDHHSWYLLFYHILLDPSPLFRFDIDRNGLG